MINPYIGIAAAAALLGASAGHARTTSTGPGQTTSDAQAQLIFGVDRVGDTSGLTQAQFYYGGNQYCWYPGGWKGPGFYYCGYAWRNGYGWGGPVGWMGYSYRGGAYYHGGVVYRGGSYYRGGTYYRGPNGGTVHGGAAYGRYGGSVRGGTVTGPGGRSASAARVTGPGGNSRTVVRRNPG